MPQERAQGDTLFVFCRFVDTCNSLKPKMTSTGSKPFASQLFESLRVKSTRFFTRFVRQAQARICLKATKKWKPPAEVQEIQSFRQSAMKRCKIPDDGMQKKILLLKRESCQALEQLLFNSIYHTGKLHKLVAQPPLPWMHCWLMWPICALSFLNAIMFIL